MRLTLAITIFVLYCPQTLFCRQLENDTSVALLRYFQFDDAGGLSCLFTYFPPLFIQHGIELKEFIRSSTFRSLRSKYGDIHAVDAIYIHAMQLTNNNTAVSLLLATIATFDHRLLGFKVPVVQLYFPLTNESLEQFQQRIDNLPSSLYSDTPPTHAGDRDKLQHFFGSAFLTFIFESRSTADRFGQFVEVGEDALIVGGAFDYRDVRSNLQGQKFGVYLLQNNHRLPSEFMKAQRISKNLTERESIHCSGVW